MVVKVKTKFEKTRRFKNIGLKLIKVKNLFHEEREIQDIMIEFYVIKRNLII